MMDNSATISQREMRENDDMIALMESKGIPTGNSDYIVEVELVKMPDLTFYRYTWFPK